MKRPRIVLIEDDTWVQQQYTRVLSPEFEVHGAANALEGIDVMHARRDVPAERDGRLLCSGPGKLCQALAVDHGFNGQSLAAAPFELAARPGNVTVMTGPRIGISKATEVPWRFGLAGSHYVSRPFR